MRRALILSAIFLTLIVAGAVGYVLFLRSNDGLVVTNPNPSLPTAGQVGTPDPIVDSTASTTPPDTTQPINTPPRLAQISKGPVVPGVVIIAAPSPENASTTDTFVRYLERTSGNIFHYNTRTGAVTRTSNRTVPGIVSASWLPDGSTALVRYLSGADFNTINTYALRADGTEGFFLPQNLTGVAVSSTSLLSLSSGVNGSAALVSKADGSSARTVFTSPLTALRASFAGKNYLAFTKPSGTLPGAAFMVDASGRFSRLAGPSQGLVALPSPSGAWALVSYVQNNTLQTTLVNTSTRESIALPVGTIVDKCVWAADSSSVYCGVPLNPSTAYTYPDDWYQGAVQFSDRIWKVDVVGRFAQLVLDFSSETSTTLDATDLAVDPQNTTLSFLNKNDRSLWVYRF